MAGFPLDSKVSSGTPHNGLSNGHRGPTRPDENTGYADDDRLEPIAIIGYAFQFPGDATDSEGFWKMMMEKRCASSEAPDRISASGWCHPDRRRRGQVGELQDLDWC